VRGGRWRPGILRRRRNGSSRKPPLLSAFGVAPYSTGGRERLLPRHPTQGWCRKSPQHVRFADLARRGLRIGSWNRLFADMAVCAGWSNASMRSWCSRTERRLCSRVQRPRRRLSVQLARCVAATTGRASHFLAMADRALLRSGQVTRARPQCCSRQP
jgi:hypothetical protein